MKKVARAVIQEFTSEQNRAELVAQLGRMAPWATLDPDRVDSWAEVIKLEFGMADPMPGISIKSHVATFNTQLINTLISEITQEPVEELHQVEPGLGRGPRPQMTPGERIESWRMNAGRRGETTREDRQGDGRIYAAAVDLTYASTSTDTNEWTAADRTGLQYDADLESGHCDYAAVSRFETPTMRAMNQGPAYASTPFGYASAASDERLLSRRIFRPNEGGVDGGIPHYRQRIQHRHVDYRAADETFEGDSHGTQIKGYDMDPLRRRQDQIKNFRSGAH